jgi:hypothetical protein
MLERTPVYTLLLSLASVANVPVAQSAETHDWFIQSINVTGNPSGLRAKDAVIIAIVDDGVRASHRDIQPFIWKNPQEVEGDGVDDDGNRFVDDVYGWDISDQDNVATPPDYRDDLYHGTHLAGIVTQIARAAYGEQAPDLVRIMPVKALADDAATTYGNFAEERDQYPAAHPTVLAVGSTEQDGSRTGNSTYGQFVDLSAPGSHIRSASIESDDSYDIHSGTSFSTAMVATAAAMVKLQHPSLSPKEVEACLKASSTHIPVSRKELKGKVGAGALNVQAAVACDVLFAESAEMNTLTSPKGFLRANRKRGSSLTWAIEPDGEFSGIRFYPVVDRKNSTDGRIEFRTGISPDGRVAGSYTLDNLPDSIFVPGSMAYVSFEPKRKRRRVDWLLEYEAETIDFSTLYCSGTKEIQSEGVLADGSGPEDYSANTDCKWLITAPPGKVVRFNFDEIDTEPRTDVIYFFNGAGTHERIMAIFSGQELPPELSTWSNQVLVWFVANGQNQGRGWQLRYRFVDPVE